MKSRQFADQFTESIYRINLPHQFAAPICHEQADGRPLAGASPESYFSRPLNRCQRLAAVELSLLSIAGGDRYAAILMRWRLSFQRRDRA
jgi:hypothetical protein